MSTWPNCSCEGDPVARYAAGVLKAILHSDEGQARRDALQASQKALVENVWRSCAKRRFRTPIPVYWVHCYTVQSEAITERLGDLTQAALSTDKFFHKAAGLSVEDGIADAFYNEQLIPSLNSLGDNSKQVTDQLKKPGTPPLVKIWKVNGSLTWHPKDVFDELVDPYNLIFADGREEGRYLHIAYPCRDNSLGVHIGGAGCYLFLQNEDALDAMPRCLLTHLRVFVQAIVTAELWRVAELLRNHEVTLRRREEVLRKTEEERRQREEERRKEMVKRSTDIRRNAGTLLKIAKAAEELANLADPLGITTTAFDRAAELAHAMFAQQPTEEQAKKSGKTKNDEGVYAPLHTVADWLKVKEDAKTALTKLVKDLRDIDKDPMDLSYPLIAAVTEALSGELDAMDHAVTEEPRSAALENALRHAKALDHSSVVTKILCATGDVSMHTVLPGNRDRCTDEPGPRYRKQALSELFREVVEGRGPTCMPAGGDLYCIELRVEAAEKQKSLGKAWDLIENRAGEKDKDFATKLARIIRGLRGRSSQVDGSYELRDCAAVTSDGIGVFFSPKRED